MEQIKHSLMGKRKQVSKIKKALKNQCFQGFHRTPWRARTADLLIKSQMLYQLS